MTDLEIPRLTMQHLKVVVTAKHQLPAEFAIGSDFLSVDNLAANTCVGIFETHRADSVGNLFEPWRRRLH